MPFPYTFPIEWGVLPALTIFIDSEAQSIKKGSMAIDLRIEERGVASFELIDLTGVGNYVRGEPVKIYDTSDTRVFAGFIDNPTVKPIAVMFTDSINISWAEKFYR